MGIARTTISEWFEFDDDHRRQVELEAIRSALSATGMSSGGKLFAVCDHNGAKGLRLGIEWEEISSAPWINEGSIRFEIEGRVISSQNLRHLPFPPTRSGTIWIDIDTPFTGEPTIDVVLSWSGGLVPSARQHSEEATIDTLVVNMREQVPHDVRFVFPSIEGSLWASESFLRQQVPYFRTTLSSDFAESSENEASDVPADTNFETKRDFDDSDDETDELYRTSYAAGIKERHKACRPCKTIRVSGTAYSTYAAVLLWLSCRKIVFAPLKSNGPASRFDVITAALSASERPAPVSPKSVYRLAHLLELDELQASAVTEYEKQLTVGNAAAELFSDITAPYPDLRNAALEYVAANYKIVSLTRGWIEIMRCAELDELPRGAAQVALLLTECLGRA